MMRGTKKDQRDCAHANTIEECMNDDFDIGAGELLIEYNLEAITKG